MEDKSQSGNSHDEVTSPSLSPVKYLRQKAFHPAFRKASVDSEVDRPNFCLNLSSSQYSVMRVYIDAPASKQIRLYYTKFTPKVKKGQICIIHGYGESTDDYLTVKSSLFQMAQYFTKRGYAINMVDLRGFGYSGGSRVNEPTVKVLSDIQTLLRNCCQRDLPTFIISHGLGAMFLNALLQQNPDLPIAGVIQVTPLIAFISNNRNLGLQRFLLKLSPTIFSNLLVHNMVNPTALAKKPLAIKNKIDSIFWESFITLHMADEYEQVGEKVRADGYKFAYPTLLCCGQKDLIQDLAQLRKYYNSLSSQDKQMIVFREGYHQLQNDYQEEELLLRIYDWIESRKNKIKWKQPKPFEKETILRKHRFWFKLGIVIAFLLGVTQLIKKLLKFFHKA